MNTLKDIHRAAQPLISPIAHDALSARLVAKAGFKAFNIGGNSLLAARHALPDLGIAGFGEMQTGIKDILDATNLPCLVDADDGYGDVKGTVRTIRAYEKIGAAGVLLEDQLRDGKQPGADKARGVAPIAAIEEKLRAALAVRASADFVVIGRTDAYGAVGLDEALRRADRFLKLGVDGVFVAGLRQPEDFRKVGETFRGAWNTAAMFEGGRTLWLSPGELHAMGFSQIVYPNSLITRVVRAVEAGLRRLAALARGDADAMRGGEGEVELDALAAAVETSAWAKLESAFNKPGD